MICLLCIGIGILSHPSTFIVFSSELFEIRVVSKVPWTVRRNKTVFSYHLEPLIWLLKVRILPIALVFLNKDAVGIISRLELSRVDNKSTVKS
jgi:hypothetical protein